MEAIAAERMPHQLVVHGVERAEFFELRDYGAGWAAAKRILEQHDVHAVKEERGKALFAFESLAARERAWRRVGGDCAGVVVRELAVYRASS